MIIHKRPQIRRLVFYMLPTWYFNVFLVFISPPLRILAGPSAFPSLTRLIA